MKKLATFIALLILWAQMGFATDSRISLTASDGSGLEMHRLEVRVVLDGFLAFTELEMVFYNPQNRRREGRFQIVLPDNAAISRFAMKIGERLQEGEVVEKQLARRAYEDFLHRRQDPALLEMDSGNRFNARIFPIEAKSEKWLLLSYSQRLDSVNGEYVLPLKGLPQLKQFSVKIFYDSDSFSTTQLGDLTGTVSKREVLTIDKHDYQPTDDFRMPYQVGDKNLAVQSEQLVAARIIPFTESTSDTQGFDNLIVFMDISASQAPYLSDSLKRLEILLPELKVGTLRLYTFDQNIKEIGTADTLTAQKALIEQLKPYHALGASRLDNVISTLKALKLEKSRLLLISDAVITAGETSATALAAQLKTVDWLERVDILIPSYHSDKQAARRLAKAGKLPGIAASLTLSDVDIIRKLTHSVYADVPITVSGSTWYWPEKVEALQTNEPLIVFAEFPPGSDRPSSKGGTVRISVGGKALSLTSKTVNPILLKREWVRARIDKLLAMEDEASDQDLKNAFHNEIINLSVKERVLSPYTSLLVLETENDYRRYNIDRRGLADILSIGVDGITVIKRTQEELVVVIPPPLTASPTARRKSARAPESEAVPPPVPGSVPPPAPVEAQLQAPAAAPLSPMFADDDDERDSLNAPQFHSRSSIVASQAISGEEVVSDMTIRGEADMSAPVPEMREQLSTEVASYIVDEEEEDIVLESTSPSEEMAGRGEEDAEAAPPAEEDGVIGRTFQAIANFFGSESSESEARQNAEAARRAELEVRQNAEAARRAELEARQRAKVSLEHAWTGRYAEFRALLDKGDIKAAGSLALQWRQENLADVMALIALGEWYEKAGDIVQAARAYGSLIDYFPARADIRRWAAERLLSIKSDTWLSIDSLEKAVIQRADHPAGHYLLAIASWEAGQYQKAVETLQAAQQHHFRRFQAAHRILNETLALMLTRLEQRQQLETLFPDQTFNWDKAKQDQLRLVLMWETDANDVDFHIYDNQQHHAFYSQRHLASGGTLYADITTGYGPECFQISEPKAFPYKVQVHYYNMGPMGYGMGVLHVLGYDLETGIYSEFRPFVVMKNRAFVELGAVKRFVP